MTHFTTPNLGSGWQTYNYNCLNLKGTVDEDHKWGNGAFEERFQPTNIFVIIFVQKCYIRTMNIPFGCWGLLMRWNNTISMWLKYGPGDSWLYRQEWL